jgi:hypothetical protein
MSESVVPQTDFDKNLLREFEAKLPSYLHAEYEEWYPLGHHFLITSDRRHFLPLVAVVSTTVNGRHWINYVPRFPGFKIMKLIDGIVDHCPLSPELPPK